MIIRELQAPPGTTNSTVVAIKYFWAAVSIKKTAIHAIKKAKSFIVIELRVKKQFGLKIKRTIATGI